MKFIKSVKWLIISNSRKGLIYFMYSLLILNSVFCSHQFNLLSKQQIMSIYMILVTEISRLGLFFMPKNAWIVFEVFQWR